MKRNYIALFIFMVCNIMVYGDTIIFKDGKSMEVFNVEESGKWILYTISKEEDSDLKRVETEKVFAIKPSDGEMVMVGKENNVSARENSSVSQTASTNQPKELAPKPSADNSKKIALYNNTELNLKKPKKESDKTKYCKDFISIWGVGEESILSDNNVEISIEPISEKTNPRIYLRNFPYYKIRVTNKTSTPIYIDLANCFKQNAKGIATPYFNNSVITESNSKGKGGSLNLGGVAGALGIGGAIGSLANAINVGGNSTKTVNISTEEQRFLMIPAKSSVYMPPLKFSGGDRILEEYEVLYFRTIPFETSILLAEGDARTRSEFKPYFHAIEETGGLDNASITKDVLQAPLGWIRNFEENESPKKITRIITYSTSPDFETFTVIPITLYIRGVMGSNKLKGVPNSFTNQVFNTSDESHLLWGTGYVEN